MTLLTTLFLLDKYGPRMSLEQIAEALGIATGTIYQRLAHKTFEIPTYVDGKMRFADTRDVAEYLDRLRERARQDLSRAA